LTRGRAHRAGWVRPYSITSSARATSAGGTQPQADWVDGAGEDDRNGCGCRPGGARRDPAGCNDYVDPKADKFYGDHRQLGSACSRPAVLDGEVAVFDKTGLAESFPPCHQNGGTTLKRAGTQEADDRQGRLLDTNRERSSGGQRAVEREKISPSHAPLRIWFKDLCRVS